MKKIEDIPDERKHVMFPTDPKFVDILKRMKIIYFERMFKPDNTLTGIAKWQILEIFFEDKEIHYYDLRERAKKEDWYYREEVFMIAFFSVRDWAETGGRNMVRVTF